LRPFRLALLTAALAVALLFVHHPACAQHPETGWSVGLAGGPRYDAQQDRYGTFLTYTGIGSGVTGQVRRDGIWQVDVDVTYHRVRRTPIAEAVAEWSNRTDRLNGGGVSATVRRRFGAWGNVKGHLGLRAETTAAQWTVRRSVRGVQRATDFFDLFATVASAVRLDSRVRPRDRVSLSGAVPVAAFVYRAESVEAPLRSDVATWPRYGGGTVRAEYRRVLSPRLSLTTAHRMHVFRYTDPPQKKRLAHQFALGLSLHLSPRR
jgi:hypothetical protein